MPGEETDVTASYHTYTYIYIYTQYTAAVGGITIQITA